MNLFSPIGPVPKLSAHAKTIIQPHEPRNSHVLMVIFNPTPINSGSPSFLPTFIAPPAVTSFV